MSENRTRRLVKDGTGVHRERRPTTGEGPTGSHLGGLGGGGEARKVGAGAGGSGVVGARPGARTASGGGETASVVRLINYRPLVKVDDCVRFTVLLRPPLCWQVVAGPSDGGVGVGVVSADRPTAGAAGGTTPHGESRRSLQGRTLCMKKCKVSNRPGIPVYFFIQRVRPSDVRQGSGALRRGHLRLG